MVFCRTRGSERLVNTKLSHEELANAFSFLLKEIDRVQEICSGVNDDEPPIPNPSLPRIILRLAHELNIARTRKIEGLSIQDVAYKQQFKKLLQRYEDKLKSMEKIDDIKVLFGSDEEMIAAILDIAHLNVCLTPDFESTSDVVIESFFFFINITFLQTNLVDIIVSSFVFFGY